MTIGISIVALAILINVMAISRNVCEIRRTLERMMWDRLIGEDDAD